ncbi:Complement C1q-like protein 2 [Bulinus truncatus]|nr:Complement C1q-like protein 2 [Bulinus truncatus]
MRLPKHVKIITSHLENLEDLKSQLGNVLDYIANIITEGQNWIDEKEARASCNFIEINQFLINETSNCIQKCLNIAHENEDSSTLTCNSDGDTPNLTSKPTLPNTGGNILKDDSKYNDVQLKLDKIDKRMTKQISEIKSLKQKVKDQEKQNEIISSQLTEKDKNTELKFKEIMEELQSASDFMSNLQSKNGTLTNEQNKHKEKLEKLIETFADYKEEMTLVTDNQEFERAQLKSIKDDMEKNFNSLTGAVQPLKNDIATVSSDLETFKTSCNNNLADYMKKSDVFQKQVENQFTKVLSKVHGKPIDFTDLRSFTSGKSIAFSVGLTKTTEVLKGDIVKYREIYANIDDSYNISTGIFTCPLDGHYIFHVGVIATCNRSVALNLYLNSEYKVSVYAYAENIYGTGGNTVILHLKQNNKVYLKTERDSELLGNATGIFNTFSGFLLFAD